MYDIYKASVSLGLAQQIVLPSHLNGRTLDRRQV
jgi:hypothetical protein